MRIGISIEKNRVSSVVVNTNGMIVNSEQTRMHGGFSETLKNNIEQLVQLRQHEITHAFIGTDFVRSLLKYHTDHTPIGVIRLAGHQPDILMPCFNWPQELKDNVLMGVETLDGGYDYDGLPITDLSHEQVLDAAQLLIEKGAQCIVICGVFSTFYPDQEQTAAQIIRDNFKVDTLECHKLGIIGFMERENAGMLNATFRKAFADKLHDIQNVFRELKMSCTLFFTQTNGAIFSLEEACLFPLQTIDSALINAFVGATKLTQYQNCCAIYMDETGSHAMVLQRGVVSEHAINNDITHDDFKVPGLHFKNIGLHSVVTLDEFRITIGEPCAPMDVKTTLTLEAAMRACNGLGNFDDPVDVITAYRIIKMAEKQLVEFYESMNNRGLKGPLVLIGPAAALFPQHEKVVVAPFSTFASAYGAAMQGLTCYLSKTLRLTNRQEQFTELCDELIQNVLAANGHNPKVVFLDVSSFRYLPEEWAQVTIVATGDIEAPPTNQQLTLNELIATQKYGVLEVPIYHTIKVPPC